MTPEEHYAEAERLASGVWDDTNRPTDVAHMLATLALVHAVLATRKDPL
jgi:hypothetical protein